MDRFKREHILCTVSVSGHLSYSSLTLWSTSDEAPEAPKDPPKATKAINIIREVKAGVFGHKEGNWLFYSVNQGTASACVDNPEPVLVVSLPNNEAIPAYPVAFPGGTYPVQTQDGICAYKNDGTGNPGALWCGDVVHSCKSSGKRDVDSIIDCSDLASKQDWGTVGHIAVATCEW
jgi:hypothetical protein